MAHPLDGKSKEELFELWRKLKQSPRVPDVTVGEEIQLEAALLHTVGFGWQKGYDEWLKQQ